MQDKQSKRKKELPKIPVNLTSLGKSLNLLGRKRSGGEHLAAVLGVVHAILLDFEGDPDANRVFGSHEQDG